MTQGSLQPIGVGTQRSELVKKGKGASPEGDFEAAERRNKNGKRIDKITIGTHLAALLVE